MNCPYCGGVTKVLDTEKYKGLVVRVRKCAECGASETTHEVPKRNLDLKAPEEKTSLPITFSVHSGI